MKGLNSPRLIPSLIASVMLAVATLAPLPGFLAPEKVYAAPATLLPLIHIGSPAHLHANGTLSIQITYTCSPTFGITTGAFQVQVDQFPTFGLSRIQLAVCNGKQHKASVTVIPRGFFSPGTAKAFAVLEDPAGNIGLDLRTITIK